MERLDLEGSDPQISPPPNTLLSSSGKVQGFEVAISDIFSHSAIQDAL